MTTPSFVAAILKGDTPIGAGFRAPKGAVFDRAVVVTCAHVVNQALGRNDYAAERPDPAAQVLLRFPFSGTRTTFSATVVVWHPLPKQRGGVAPEDIAVLALDGSPPDDVRYIEADPDPRPLQRKVRAFGFPAGYPSGQEATGSVVAIDAVGWLTVLSDKGELPFVPGHSGSAVVDDRSGQVVGMVSLADDARRDIGVVVPSRALGTAWLPLARPYRGLEKFDSSTAHLFKGREKDTATLVDLVRRHRAVIVVGGSGSGKSSLIRAGVLPALDDRWRVVVMEPGEDPRWELERRLQGAGAVKIRLDTEDGCRTAVREALGTCENLLLVVDQFEQLWTRTKDSRRYEFLNLLLEEQRLAVADLHVLLAVRADFFAELTQDGRLRPILNRAQMALGPLDRPDLRRAIVEPMQAYRVAVPDTAAEAILGELGTQSGDGTAVRLGERLPLLQLVMTDIWQRTDPLARQMPGDPLPDGVDGAIRTHAQRVVAERLAGSEQRVLDLLARLGTETGEGQVASRFVSEASIGEADWNEIVLPLAEERLILTDRRRDAVGAEVVHEAIFRLWPGLPERLRSRRAFDEWRRRLADFASYRDPESDFLTGRRLSEALTWRSNPPEPLTGDEIDLIDASQKRVLSDVERQKAELEEKARLQEELRRRAEAVAEEQARRAEAEAERASQEAARVRAEEELRRIAETEAAEQVRRADAEQARAEEEATLRRRAQEAAELAVAAQRSAKTRAKSALAASLIALAAAGTAGYAWWQATYSEARAKENENRAVAATSEANAQLAQARAGLVWSRLDDNDYALTDEEVTALWWLATDKPATREAFIGQLRDESTGRASMTSSLKLGASIRPILRAFWPALPPPDAAAALAPVLDAIKATTYPDQLVSLAQAVQALAPTPTQAATALAAIKLTDLPYQLRPLARAVQALAPRLDPIQAAAALATVLDAIKATTDPDQLGTLAHAVQALAPKLDPTHAATALAPVLDAIKATTDLDRLGALAQAVQALTGTLDATASEQLRSVAVAGLAAGRTPAESAAWAGTVALTTRSTDLSTILVNALKFPSTAAVDADSEDPSATDLLLAALRDRYPDAPRTGDLDAMLPWLRQTFGADLVDRPLRMEDRPPPFADVVRQIDLKALAGAQGD